MEKQSKPEKKIKGKPVAILQSNLIEKQLNSKYNSFQRRIAKIIKVELADTYQYLFRFTYRGSVNLKLNDIVYNSENLAFVVVKISLRMAVVVSVKSYSNQPLMRGTLIVFKGDKK